MGRRDTRLYEEMINQGRTAFLSAPLDGMLEGGVPVVVDGQVIGAVGVSGMKPNEDAQIAKAGVAAGHELKQVYDTAMRELRPKYGHWVIFEHCMPFDVSRAYDEAQGIDNPRIWTAERDIDMWRAMENAA